MTGVLADGPLAGTWVAEALVAGVIALPFATAAVLAVVGSWRAGVWIIAGSAGLQFVAACALPWAVPPAEAHLALLTSLVVMTTSWFGPRDIAAALEGGVLNRWRVRRYHVGCQALVGGAQLAVLGGDPFVAWIGLVVVVAAAAAMTGAVLTPAAAAAASRLVRLCGAGLVLALLGTLLLDRAPFLAGLLLLVGYGAIAGLLPLHAWLADAAAEGVAPGAILVTVVQANVPLLLFLRSDIAPGLQIGFGLAALLAGAVALVVRSDRRRMVAMGGLAQLGLVVFALGTGATAAAWLLLTLLSLLRAAVLQSDGDDLAAWLAFALVPLYALYLLAGPTVAVSAWLLLPLAGGAAAAACGLLAMRPAGIAVGWAAAPAWLEVALAAALALAMPDTVLAWFRAAVEG